ncbi:hypothetical protein Ocin01_12699 [Orchesella cincta]|uniref:Uncharacterized protein n=1 Tax=Orchesella cincta TaxID=48709 RepID=A0A1D2MM37_ORCCI|nr:hypothetical protein Ocin01_12699 [Orchesella cincta]
MTLESIFAQQWSGAGARDTIARLEVTSQDQVPPPIIQFGPVNQTLPLTTLQQYLVRSMALRDQQSSGLKMGWS